MHYPMNNSYAYISLEMANTMFLSMPADPSWLNATDNEKTAALCHAARVIDSLTYRCSSKNSDQPLKFPLICDALDEVPDEVIAANMIEAIAILNTPFDTRQNLINSGVTSVTVGDVHESYGHGQSACPLKSRLSLSLLRPWLLSSCRL